MDAVINFKPSVLFMRFDFNAMYYIIANRDTLIVERGITMAKKKYTQEEVNRILWRACDTFRGKIDS